MNINNIEAKKNLQIDREYVEGLIYENIRLMDENIELYFQNKQLKKTVEELEKANKRMRLSNLLGEGDGNVVIVVRKENKYKI